MGRFAKGKDARCSVDHADTTQRTSLTSTFWASTVALIFRPTCWYMHEAGILQSESRSPMINVQAGGDPLPAPLVFNARSRQPTSWKTAKIPCNFSDGLFLHRKVAPYLSSSHQSTPKTGNRAVGIYPSDPTENQWARSCVHCSDSSRKFDGYPLTTRKLTSS